MSYILDALNKSEQERQSRQSPGINSNHRKPVPTQNNSKHWFLILIALTAVNSIGVYFWLQQSKPVVANLEKANIEKADLNKITPNQPELVKTVVQDRTKPDIALADLQATPTGNFTAQETIETLALVDISDLPDSIKTKIPNLDFSTHLYGKDKDFRMVNINGVMIHEGEAVTPKIQLIEITEQGVILKYQQYLFEVGVLTNWQTN